MVGIASSRGDIIRENSWVTTIHVQELVSSLICVEHDACITE